MPQRDPVTGAEKVPQRLHRREGESTGAYRSRITGEPRRLATANRAVQSTRQLAAPEFKEYQGIILVEFILAELLVSVTPIATRQNQPGLSPYIPRDMIKLLSIGLVYFLLELGAVAGHSWGRFGAWFGGLILLTVGLNEAGNIAKDLDIFGLATAAAASTQAGSPSTATKEAVKKIQAATSNVLKTKGSTHGGVQ